MKLLRTAEILAWTVGVSMLVTYAASRSWFAYGREQGIASFAMLERVDMSAWSRERIAQ